MKRNEITVILAGYSYCYSGKALLEMPEKDSHGNFFTRIERNKKFNGYELLVNQQARLFARGSSTVASQHPFGRHAYRCSSLPSLFEGHSGQIRYYMEAKVDRPWKSDYKTRKPFTVNEIIDINLPQYSTVPFGSEEKQIVGYLCRVAGNLTMQASRDRSGYSPGQHISLSALCVNVSTLEMRSMRATLVQRILYRLDDGHTVDVSYVIGSFEGERIPSRSQDLWNNRPFLIPPVPPTIRTKPVTVSYQVIFEVNVPWPWGKT
ncbi:arrestin domain-containing protein 3-like [Dendronephthya gigantea]|uniref:arrestin domain-containing protein 3-like n=1 Tax=Dendronephthya gigantea TaxID=151771 RepID=UPI00106D8E80|nr:arrestin domain-containing protein 3-like [Dendronephthya gigantea]